MKEKKIAFTEKEHAPTLTSEESARVRGSRLEQGAKAMLLRHNGVYSLCVMSAALKLDLKLVKVRSHAIVASPLRICTERTRD